MDETIMRFISWLAFALALLGLVILWRPERLGLW